MRRLFFLVLTVLAVVYCSGCAGTVDKQNDAAKKQSYVVQDVRGKKLSFESKPQKIISLYVYGDEVLLGLVDHKRIAGLSKWVHDEDLAMGAKEAKYVPQIAESNPEAILALKPDLVLLPDSSKPEQISSLEDVGIKVFVYPAASRLSNIPKTIKAIGGAVGEPEQAEKLIAEMQKKISAVEAKVKKMQPEDRKKGLLFLRFGALEAQIDLGIGAIGGKGIIFNDIMTAAGVEDCYEAARHTIADKPGTSRILSKEEVVQANPDYIIIATWSQGGAYKAGNAQLEELYADPALATVTAVKKKQAIVIPQGYVNCLSQHAADSVELLHEAVYGK